jgi:deoxyguanosine kinase
MTYIVIEGPIGVGKTTLAKLLGERLNMALMLEGIDEGEDADRVKLLLSNFYVDRARYAFQTEVFFLLNRYRQQSVVKAALAEGDIVADYLFAKTRLFAGMNLSSDEFALFEQIYEALSRQVTRPDLVIYLTASVDTLMARIYRRDRSFERSMARAYIEQLSGAYSRFFDGYDESPLLMIETDQLDLVHDSGAQDEVIARITAALAGSDSIPKQPS